MKHIESDHPYRLPTDAGSSRQDTYRRYRANPPEVEQRIVLPDLLRRAVMQVLVLKSANVMSLLDGWLWTSERVRVFRCKVCGVMAQGVFRPLAERSQRLCIGVQLVDKGS